MTLFDTHTHSFFSPDGIGSAAEMCLSAAERGLCAISLTEHFDLNPPRYPFSARTYLKLESERMSEMERLRKEYEGAVDVLCGIELGHPSMERELASDFLSSRKFDIVIGSIHCTSDGNDIYTTPYPTSADARRMLDLYFEDLYGLVSEWDIDVAAHINYPMRVVEGRVDSPSLLPWEDIITRILEKAALRGIALEINSRSMSTWIGRLDPELWVLRRFREVGGRYVTFGSDAHSGDRVADGFYDAARLALAAGFTHLTYFKDRTPFEIPITLDVR